MQFQVATHSHFTTITFIKVWEQCSCFMHKETDPSSHTRQISWERPGLSWLAFLVKGTLGKRVDIAQLGMGFWITCKCTADSSLLILWGLREGETFFFWALQWAVMLRSEAWSEVKHSLSCSNGVLRMFMSDTCLRSHVAWLQHRAREWGRVNSLSQNYEKQSQWGSGIAFCWPCEFMISRTVGITWDDTPRRKACWWDSPVWILTQAPQVSFALSCHLSSLDNWGVWFSTGIQIQEASQEVAITRCLLWAGHVLC